MAADKGNSAQVLKRDAEGGDYSAIGDPIVLFANPEKPDLDLDIEAIAVASGQFTSPDPTLIDASGLPQDSTSPTALTSRTGTVLPRPKKSPKRRGFYQFEIDAGGKLVDGSLRRGTLAPLLENRYLAASRKAPGRENGTNFEALAAGQDGQIHVGCRSPVLRGGFVPVFSFRGFPDARLAAAECKFVDLRGSGIRDMVKVSNGFLLLAGPVLEEHGDCQIYHWDGIDMVPGVGSPGGKATPLAKVAGKENVEAEGLALLAESRKDYDVLVVFDGAKNGGMRRMTVPKRQ